MKRSLLMASVLIVVLPLLGCDNKSEEQKQAEQTQEQQPAPAPAPSGEAAQPTTTQQAATEPAAGEAKQGGAMTVTFKDDIELE